MFADEKIKPNLNYRLADGVGYSDTSLNTDGSGNWERK